MFFEDETYKVFIQDMRDLLKKDEEFKNHDIIKQEFIPDLKDIINIRENYKNQLLNNNLSETKKKIIYRKYLCSCLYTYQPPRRELDYKTMVIIDNLKKCVSDLKDYGSFLSSGVDSSFIVSTLLSTVF